MNIDIKDVTHCQWHGKVLRYPEQFANEAVRRYINTFCMTFANHTPLTLFAQLTDEQLGREVYKYYRHGYETIHLAKGAQWDNKEVVMVANVINNPLCNQRHLVAAVGRLRKAYLQKQLRKKTVL